MKEKRPWSLAAILKNEDWLSIVIAAIILLLSVIGLLGPNGLQIKF